MLGPIRLALQPCSIGQPIVYPVTSLSPKRTEADSENKDRGRSENYYQFRITHACSLQIVMWLTL